MQALIHKSLHHAIGSYTYDTHVYDSLLQISIIPMGLVCASAHSNAIYFYTIHFSVVHIQQNQNSVAVCIQPKIEHTRYIKWKR